MDFRMNVRFKITEKENKVKCVALFDGKTFIRTWKIQQQADRVNAVKRAKHLAYVGCMAKIHGYVCQKIIK